MQFVTGSELTEAIREVVQSKGVRLAVAFWGRDAHARLGISTPLRSPIICNLSMGGTNPKAIRALEDPAGAKTKWVRHCPTLHAKVFISDTIGVVGSANVSANGLGFEGDELKGWIEAGIVTHDAVQLRSMRQWFDKLWKKCAPVDDDLLLFAEEARKRLRSVRVGTGSLANIDPESEDVPLLTWYTHRKWKVHEANVRRQMGSFDDALKARVDEGIELDSDDDVSLLREGRWVLWWKRLSSGLPATTPLPEWQRTSGVVVRKAYSYVDAPRKLMDVVLPSEGLWKPPFEIDAEMASRICNLLRDSEFDDLRSGDYEGAWFAPREELMRDFWRRLKRG